MMVKKVILICCVFLLLTSCNFDPYSDQRPSDYGNGLWICDEYNIWFCVDLEKNDYYDPEGELQIENNAYFCKFYFIHQTNRLHISVYPIEYADVSDELRNRDTMVGKIEGECVFSSKSLVFTIDKIEGSIFDGNIENMTFQRMEIPCE